MIISINFCFFGQKNVYWGKVCEVYMFENDLLVMVVIDCIFVFDYIFLKGIFYKGQVLNQVVIMFFDVICDIVLNWLIGILDLLVVVGYVCELVCVEMVICGYFFGYVVCEYKVGKWVFCGVIMLEGMIENDCFFELIIILVIKVEEGYDEDILCEEILCQGLVFEEIYMKMEVYIWVFFQCGIEMVVECGLILVDMKYEFGV